MADKYRTFINPGGVIEQHFFGAQTPHSFIASVKDLVKYAEKLKSQNQKALILVDLSNIPGIDITGKMSKARQEAIKAMKTADYDRIAVYGKTHVQLVVNTLVMIAGEKNKVRVFNQRAEAVKWLKNGD